LAGVELPFYPIWCGRSNLAMLNRYSEAALALCLNASLAPQPCHAMFAAGDTGLVERFPGLDRTIGLSRLFMHAANVA
jgi:hypothetical protein